MPPFKARKEFRRAAVEVGFIVFLFYSNLLMGEFTRTNGHGKTLSTAISNIFTLPNFCIGIVAAVIAHAAFELLRERVKQI